MRFVHRLHSGTRSADVVGLLGTRLGGLVSVGLPVAPGFIVGTATWHLWHVCGERRGLPAGLVEEVRGALAELEGGPLCVRPAPAIATVTAGPRQLVSGSAEALEAALRQIISRSHVPAAVIVQVRTDAEGEPPSGHGRAFTRDPFSGTVWPVGEFRSSGRTPMSLDELNRRVPAAGIQLRAALARVESLHRSVCEVGFTLEAGRLWIDDARPVWHSAVVEHRLTQSGLRPAPAAGPGS